MVALTRKPEGFCLSPTEAVDALRGNHRGRHATVSVARLVRGALEHLGAVDTYKRTPRCLVARSRAELLAGFIANATTKSPLVLAASSTHSQSDHPQQMIWDAADWPDTGAMQDVDLPPEVLWQPEDPILSFLTSGSTGTPQVFDKSALQLMTEAEQLSLLLRLDATSTVTSTTAAHHLYGFLFGILAPYFGGASVVCDEANEPGVFHPHRLADLVERTNTTHLVTVPAHLSALVSARPNMSQLSTIVSSAAALDSELAKAAESILKVELIDVFGSTETGGIATRRRARTAEWTPLPGVECAIDSEQHLIIRSPYADTCPMVTSERVRQRPGGRFEYLGRGDGVVKIGGKRVSLSELEARAMEISGVRDARAIAKSVERMRGTEIWLALEGEIDRRSVLACLRRCLDPVFLPRRIRILPRLPRDERGKLKRSDLLRLFESES